LRPLHADDTQIYDSWRPRDTDDTRVNSCTDSHVVCSWTERWQDWSNMVWVIVEAEQAGLLCPNWLKQDPTGFYRPWPRPVHGQRALNEAAHRHSAARHSTIIYAVSARSVGREVMIRLSSSPLSCPA